MALGGFKFVLMQSVGIAIYSLVVYLYNFKSYIGHYKPFWKFFSIKIILVLSIWQKIILRVVKLDKIFILDKAYLKRSLEPADYLDNTLVSIEMFILAILAIKYFSYQDFKAGHNRNTDGGTLSSIIAIPMIL